MVCLVAMLGAAPSGAGTQSAGPDDRIGQTLSDAYTRWPGWPG